MRFLQLVHVKGAAVLHFNVVFPSTAIVCPMVTNFTSHFTVCHRGMLSFDPPWGMRATTKHRWTCSGHLWVTWNTSKAIPTRSNISVITSDWVLSGERFEAVGCIEALVVAARVKSCSSWWKNDYVSEVIFNWDYAEDLVNRVGSIVGQVNSVT